MYEHFYGLRARPFEPIAAPSLYYEGDAQRRETAHLRHALEQKEGVIVLTGKAGSGKSALAAHLIHRMDSHATTVGFLAAKQEWSSLELLRAVLEAFGLTNNQDDEAQLLADLERFLQSEARAGRSCLLVVDECQVLEEGALLFFRILADLALGNQRLLQSLLLGRAKLRKTLSKHSGLEPLRERIIASHHIQSFDADDTRAYVMHRMEKAGWSGEPAFEDALFEPLYQATGGNPRRINQLMNRLLLLGSVEESEALTPSMLLEVLAETGSTQKPSPQAESVQMDPVLSDDDGLVGKGVSDVTDNTQEAQPLSGLADDFPSDAGASKSTYPTDGVAADTVEPADAELIDAIERLENRVAEQEQSLRHVLTMLIEWLEDEDPRKVA